MKIGKSLLISLVGILLIISISSVSAGLFDSITDAAGGNSDLTVENITLTDEGYGLYKVNCDMIPKKDFSYLEMQVVFYDNGGAIVGKSPLVWNINEVKEGQLLKVTGNAYLDSSSNTPSTAEIIITDSALGDSDQPIFAENVTMS